MASIAVMFATIDRPYCAQRLVKSIRRFAPAAAIYVADQSERSDAAEHFYRINNVNVIWMPYDSGVTASRNALLEIIQEDFVVLCDDDFVFTEDTKFSDAITHFDNSDSFDIIAGRLIDYWSEGSSNRYWENFLSLDREHRILFTIPIYGSNPVPVIAGGVNVYRCDAVMNWFVARMSIFQSGLRWDEQFKSNGEHEDFFLNIKENTNFSVGYLPSMVCDHRPPQTKSYERLRSRTGGWRLFMEKWGIDQMVEVGRHCRTMLDPGRDWPYEGGPKRFFTSAPFRRDREWSSASAGVDIVPGGGLSPRNYFSPEGERLDRPQDDNESSMIGPITTVGYRAGSISKSSMTREVEDCRGSGGEVLAGYIDLEGANQKDVVVWLWNPSSEVTIQFDTAWIFDGKFAGYGALRAKATLHESTWTAVHLDAPPALGRGAVQNRRLVLGSPEMGRITISAQEGEGRSIGLMYERIDLSPAIESSLSPNQELVVDFDGIHVLKDIPSPTTLFVKEHEGTGPADMAKLPPVKKGDILSLPHYRRPNASLLARVYKPL